MKVKELIEELQRCDPDRLVIISKDEEGNGYLPIADVSADNNSFSEGELSLEYLTDELCDKGYTEEDIGEGEPAVVLWP